MAGVAVREGVTHMAMVTCDISMSVDGIVAGPNQRLEVPLGDGVEERLHRWMFEGAEDNAREVHAITEAGAFIMGRNMFSPGRGAWDMHWKGWWGDDPPYHAPVFVLTHHAREPLEMQGGTTFFFVTDGPESALARARDAAGDASVAIAGGAATVNEYLALEAIDELRLHVAPWVMGEGERLFHGVGRIELEPVGVRASRFVTHLTYRIARRPR
jgi:dihydrofolate reductase